MPLDPEQASEAEVDWGTAWVRMNGEDLQVKLFCMRSRYSGKSFVRAYRWERQEMLLDGHIRGFGWYGGVFPTVVFDNLKTAVKSVVAWIGAEMEFVLSQAVASGDTFEHRPSECGHCVQDFLADLDLRDLPGEAAGSESGADDALPPADLRFYPAALVVPCGHLPGHAAVAADLGNMAILNGWIPRRWRADHGVLWRRYNHIQGFPIPFPQHVPCGRPIIGAVRQKASDRGIELIQEPVSGLLLSSRHSCPISFSRRFFSAS